MTRSATTMGHREPATHRSPGRPGPRGGSQEHGCGSLSATQDTGSRLAALWTRAFACLGKVEHSLLRSPLGEDRGQTPSPRCLRRGRAGRGLHQKPTWRARVMSGARKPRGGLRLWGVSRHLPVSHGPGSVRKGCNYRFSTGAASAASSFQSHFYPTSPPARGLILTAAWAWPPSNFLLLPPSLCDSQGDSPGPRFLALVRPGRKVKSGGE